MIGIMIFWGSTLFILWLASIVGILRLFRAAKYEPRDEMEMEK